MDSAKQEVYLQDWKTHEACAERMLPIIGRMYRENNVVPTVYGRALVHCSVIDILKAHRFARLIIDTELSVTETWPLLEAMSRLDLAPARVDLGKLAVKYQSMDGAMTVDDFVRQELIRINTGRALCGLNLRMSCCTVLAGSVDCSPVFWSRKPAAAKSCASGRRSCARKAPMTC